MFLDMGIPTDDGDDVDGDDDDLWDHKCRSVEVCWGGWRGVLGASSPPSHPSCSCVVLP